MGALPEEWLLDLMRQNTPALKTERGQLFRRARGGWCHSTTQCCSEPALKQSLHVGGSPGSTGFLQPGNWSFWPLNLSSLSCNNFLEAAGTSHTCSSHFTAEQKTRTQPIRKCTSGGPNLPYSLSNRGVLRMLRFQSKVIPIGQQGIHFSWPHILKSPKIKCLFATTICLWQVPAIAMTNGTYQYTFSFSSHHLFYHKPFSDDKTNMWIAPISLTKN